MTETRTTETERAIMGNTTVTDNHIAIIGTGFSGICAAIKLKEAGIEDFVIYERADDIGGTWRDNTYPGAACDVPSVLYSFSFAQNPEWTRTYSPWNEIHDYLVKVSKDFEIDSHIKYGAEVSELRFDDSALNWTVSFTSGESVTARSVISCVGILSQPSIPQIPGLESFEGTSFHSAQWRHDHNLDGEKVAVIGTGASAIQFVPKIANDTEKLYVFQRSPHWVTERGDQPISTRTRRLYRRFPLLQRFERWRTYWDFETLSRGFLGNHPKAVENYREKALEFLAEQVPDPGLRAKLTPDYDPGCKRRLVSDEWYPTLQRDDVELVTERIAEIRPHSIVTTDGEEHEVDTIIFGTGFTGTSFLAPMKVFGRRGIELSDAWKDGAATKLGVATHGFPNLFIMFGPNAGLGHNSVVFMIEAQARYITKAVKRLLRSRGAALDLDLDVQTRWYEQTQKKMRKTVWVTGGCSSWYQSADGRVDTLWPDLTPKFWWQARLYKKSDFVAIRPQPN
ncbi:NAD(P)/FAD-dependent oxidoreductase [Rhodococcus rhodochrous]|nr:NAD(P)/FAD-dependent oxidoreductase [Rhodococcus rhodochrous]